MNSTPESIRLLVNATFLAKTIQLGDDERSVVDAAESQGLR